MAKCKLCDVEIDLSQVTSEGGFTPEIADQCDFFCAKCLDNDPALRLIISGDYHWTCKERNSIGIAMKKRGAA